jgi:hypothetical protein
MSMKNIDQKEAEKLKKGLREAAKGGPGQRPVDLKLPSNKYSVWFRNGEQGFLCKGAGGDPAAAWALIGEYHLHDALILEASATGDKVTHIECSVG